MVGKERQKSFLDYREQREAERGADLAFAESDLTVARCSRIEEEREFE